jgi:cytochrome c oxidase subunit IV
MSEQIISPRAYCVIFALLIALTCLTVGISFLDLGPWHTVAGLAIAVCKALLVALFSMHVLYSTRLTWLVIAAALFWLAILLALTLADYLTRHLLSY